VPRRVDDDCLQEMRWLYDRRDLAEARRDLAAWLAKWSGKYSKLTGWVEENIDERHLRKGCRYPFRYSRRPISRRHPR
jgi:transposase-like protein